jgi:hypothetical protein
VFYAALLAEVDFPSSPEAVFCSVSRRIPLAGPRLPGQDETGKARPSSVSSRLESSPMSRSICAPEVSYIRAKTNQADP